MSVLSRLNSNEQVTTGLYRAFNAENKVWLIFVQEIRKAKGQLLILDLKMQKLTCNGYL